MDCFDRYDTHWYDYIIVGAIVIVIAIAVVGMITGKWS